MIYLIIIALYLSTGALFALHSYREDGRILIALASIVLWWFVLVGMMLSGLLEKEKKEEEPARPRVRNSLYSFLF